MDFAYDLEMMARAERERELDEMAQAEIDHSHLFLGTFYWLLIDMMLTLIVSGEVTFVRAGIRFW